MTFFNKKKLQPRPIKIDNHSISSGSLAVKLRLERISDNYLELESALADVEAKIQSDERLSAIDQSLREFELARKKKKWRPRKKKKTGNPKKPR